VRQKLKLRLPKSLYSSELKTEVKKRCFKSNTCVRRRTRPGEWKRYEITNKKCVARNSFEFVKELELIFMVECWV
jgi:hypothetical protein